MIPTAPFGKTGHESTRTIFGAAAFMRCPQADADRTLEVLLEYGINHIDTAASYGDAELRLAPWMSAHRDRFFLATKTGERTYAKAKEQIANSLKRMNVDHVDLIQLHNLVDPEEWETAMGPDGALKAAIEARDAGKARFIGVTGHGVTVAAQHKKSLERFPFDAVLLPYNFVMMQNPEYAAEFQALYSLVRERGIAMQTIKGITLAPWGEKERTTTTWYEPLQEPEEIAMAVRWVLGKEGVYLNTASDIRLLPLVLKAASEGGPRPTDSEMQGLVERRNMAPLFV